MFVKVRTMYTFTHMWCECNAAINLYYILTCAFAYNTV